MIRHVVMFRFRETFTPEVREAWVNGLEAMQGRIPGMMSLQHGRDVMSTASSWDDVLIVDFAAADDIDTYNSHPLHEVVKSYSLPNIDQIAYVDYEVA